MKVVVATQNPVKIESARAGFEKMFPDAEISVERVNASSDVADQPMSEEETYLWAKNRAFNAHQVMPDADYRVWFEAGIWAFEDELYTHARVVVLGKDTQGQHKIGRAHTWSIFLPKKVSELVLQGMELGDADDIVFNMKDSKKANWAVGILTWDAITRTDGLTKWVIAALVPFKNPELY